MELRNRLVVSIIIFIALIFVGGNAYHYVEGWSYLDSFYFTVVTVTTIGYGDLAPVTDTGKIFTMFYCFLGILMVFYFISLAGRYMFSKHLRERLVNAGRIKKRRGVKRVGK